MFLFDAKDRARARRLPPRRARFRRARDVERLGRAAVAAAARAAAAADQRLLRIRGRAASGSSSASGASPTTRTWPRSTTGARAPGSSRSATGARGTWSWSRSRSTTRSTTTSSPTGGRSAADRRGQRALAHLPAELGLGRARPQRAPARRAHPVAAPGPTAGGASSSTSPATPRTRSAPRRCSWWRRPTPAALYDAEISENPEINGPAPQLRSRPRRRRSGGDARRASLRRAARSPRPGSTDGAADRSPGATRTAAAPRCRPRRRWRCRSSRSRTYDRERRGGSRARRAVRLAPGRPRR